MKKLILSIFILIMLIPSAGCSTADPLTGAYLSDVHIGDVVLSDGDGTLEVSGGQAVLTGDAVVWDDLRVTVNSLRLSGVKPPTWTSYKGSEVLAFSDQAIAGNEEIVYFSIQLPHTYRAGSRIYPHVHFVPEDNAGGNVRWQFTYTWANVNDAFPAQQPIYVNAACGTVTDAHKKGSFSPITGTGKEISSMLLCELRRNSSDANDTYNGKNVYLLEFDVHYQIDGFGSKEELRK